MSDQSERLKAIGEYLEKMTAAPWSAIVAKTLIHVETDLDNPIGGGIPICSMPKSKEADADGIYQLRNDAPWLLSELLAEIRKREEAERLLDHVWSEHMDDEEIAACAMKLDVMRVLNAAGGCGVP